MISRPRVVDIAGTPYEVGLAHGRALQREIRRVIDIYRAVLGRSDHELRRATTGTAAAIAAFAPSIVQEMEGIADGADVAPWWIQVLNRRSELMADSRDGCTAVFVPDHGLLGQTWDWLDVLEPLVTVLRVRPTDGIGYVTLTEPGVVAKIGLNTAGLGVTLNFLYAPGPHRGVPVHVLLRRLLACATLTEAQTVLVRAGTGRAANVIVGTASTGGVNATFAGDEVRLTHLDRPFAHTNHLIDTAPSSGPLEASSRARLDTARRLVPSLTTVGDLVDALDDRTHPDHPICAPYVPYLGGRVGTTATVAMDLAARRAYIRCGPRPGAVLTAITVPTQEPT